MKPELETTSGSSPTPLHARRAARPLAAAPVDVAADAAWSQVIERGAAVTLLAGKVWLTFENEGEDHILEAPATFFAPHPGRVAVWAFTAATLAVQPAPEHQLAA